MSGMWKSAFGQGDYFQNVNTAGPSEIELILQRIGMDVAADQRANIESLQPFQRQMMQQAMMDLNQQGLRTQMLNETINPALEAQFAGDDLVRAGRLGDIQSQLAEMNVSDLMSGGAATKEQQARIKDAADAAFAAGATDIDTSTKRGVGIIADEVANARGLRMTDTPIMREATLLARSGQDQKSALSANIRANMANATLQYPLAAMQTMSGINMAQQGASQSATQFQEQLRMQAQQNRLSMYGTTANAGIGIGQLGAGTGASMLASMGDVRKANTYTSGFNPAQNMSGAGSYLNGAGNLMQGIGSMFSDRHLKTDITRVGQLPSGIPIYTFRFVWSDEMHVGVIADEVLPVIPAAVSKHKDGYHVVDYGKLR